MHEIKNHPVPESFKAQALIDNDQYLAMYKHSVENPDAFWSEQALKFVQWDQPWSKVSDYDLKEGRAIWFQDAKLNVSTNCLDRHLETRGDQIAIIWEGDDPAESRAITYRELHLAVCRLANALKSRGVRKGDRVCIYMPMIPEAAYAMLACARIGAVHSIVFGGFSPEALKDRILDSDCQTVITADEGLRGGRQIPLKENADIALQRCPDVHTCLVVKRTGGDIEWKEGRDVWYHDLVDTMSDSCAPELMDAEDPLFILYTSGSTGKPKGVLHTTGGYLLGAAITHKYVFDYQEGDIYWCTADIGWITGHSYIVYGPLANGAITLMFEGVPTYPDASRCWQVIDKHDVTIFYTAPTAIRALMAQGNDFVTRCSRKTLSLLGTVGEPINHEAWEWYKRVIGENKVPIVDTWWQTETGGIMISGLGAHSPMKPAHAGYPLPGIQPALLNQEGRELEGNEVEGHLCITYPWPGMLRTTYGDHERCRTTYFSHYPGFYFTGDGARRDAQGMYRIIGRVDDVINVSGHRFGTAEIENAINANSHVAESAVVGYPHDIKGQGIYAFVVVKDGHAHPEVLKAEIVETVVEEIGKIAKPDVIQLVPGLPKTRSGKIMRRILRKVAAGEFDQFGDTSTLLNPEVVDEIVAQAKAHR